MKRKLFAVFTLMAFLLSFLPIQPLFAASSSLHDRNQPVTIIVELQKTPVLAREDAKTMGAKAYGATTQADTAGQQLQREQAAVLAKIAPLCQAATKGAQPMAVPTPRYHYTHVFNGFSLEVPQHALAAIEALPEVRAIYPVEQHPFVPASAPAAATSLQQCCQDIHVNSLRQQGIRGEGQTIAVIDSELDIHHEFFAGEVAQPALRKDYINQLLTSNALNIDISQSIDNIYRSSKLPFVYNYANHSPNVFGSHPNVVHGSHVSGIACGRNGHLPNGERFDGVAPEAQLVFMGIVGGSDITLDDDAILAAIDDATKLQVDAINMSFGVPYIRTHTPAAKALTNAKNAGIFLSVAAGNSARGDIETNNPPTLPPALIDYHSLGQPANFPASTTVAASEQPNRLAAYSSWGGTTDLELKPELTAPGGHIYSAVPSNQPGDNAYAYRSGTSMATPHISGSVTLLKQYIESHPSQYPAIDPRQLSGFIENLMMSTATVLPNAQQPHLPASPRQQGAGLLNLKAAIETPVILLGNDGKSKCSLRENINEDTQQFHFTCQVYNFSTQAVTYDQLSLSVLSDALRADGTIGGMKALDTTAIDLPDHLTVPAGEQVTLPVTVTLDPQAVRQQSKDFPNGFFVDGFLTLASSSHAVPAVHLPYSGFYGDWTKAPALDQPNYSGQSQLHGTYLYTTVDSLQAKPALGTNDLFECFISEEASYPKTADETYSGISPNGDGWGDQLAVCLKTLRNATIEAITITNAHGHTVAQVAYPDTFDSKLTSNNAASLQLEDALSAQPDGDFTLNITGHLDYPGARRETIHMHFYTDRVAPRITAWQILQQDGHPQLRLHASDNRGLMGVLIDGQRKDTNAYESTILTTTQLTDLSSGDFSTDLSSYKLDTISVTVFDYALNHTRVYGTEALPFKDVPTTAWYYDAVCYTKAHGLMSGIDEQTFAPTEITDRAQLVTTLWRMAGSPTDAPPPDYNDLYSKSYYYPAVAWATEAGIISGYSDGRFAPNDPLTREQMASIFYRFARYQQQTTAIDDTCLHGFSDAQNIQPWAKDAFCWAVANGLISGTSATTLSPQGSTSRAQLATVLTNYHQKEVQP